MSNFKFWALVWGMWLSLWSKCYTLTYSWFFRKTHINALHEQGISFCGSTCPFLRKQGAMPHIFPISISLFWWRLSCQQRPRFPKAAPLVATGPSQAAATTIQQHPQVCQNHYSLQFLLVIGNDSNILNIFKL